jgi:hypothetical protein
MQLGVDNSIHEITPRLDKRRFFAAVIHLKRYL